MLSSIFAVVILLLGFHRTKAIVDMCTDQSSSSTDAVLKFINGSDVSSCNCSVTLGNTDTLEAAKARITFEIVEFYGCKYKLAMSYNDTSPIFSCSHNSTVYHDMDITDEINLYLERDGSSLIDTEFIVQIKSNVTATGVAVLRLKCFPPNTNLNTQSISSQTPERTTISSSPYTISTIEPTVSVPSTKQDYDNNDVVHAGIIGGAIGLVVGGVIVGVLICIILRIMKYRKTKEIYSSPSPPQYQPDPIYADIQLGNDLHVL